MRGQRGLSMIEAIIAMGLFGVLALAVTQFSRKSEKQIEVASERINNTVARLGGSKVMINDIAVSMASFDLLNILDDRGMPFFVYSRSELCMPASTDKERCSRKIVLSIPKGEVRSKPFFLIINKGYPSERLQTELSPRRMFAGGTYQSFNPDAADSNLTIAKTASRPDSPWDAGRLILISSVNSFYDCHSMAHGSVGATCDIKCPVPGTCDHATERPLALLGIVKKDYLDLQPVAVEKQPSLLKTNYLICLKPTCSSSSAKRLEVVSTKDLIEGLPYLPGLNNNVSYSPVQMVRYHLERPSADAPDHKILLMRSVSTIVGSSISFAKAHILSSGVQGVEFFRENISHPNIKFKLIVANKRVD